MKKITLFLFVLVLGFKAQAQISQDFESAAFPPTGWTITSTNTGYTWIKNTLNAINGNSASVAYDPLPANQNETLTSPLFSVPSGTSFLIFKASLSYFWAITENNYDCLVSVSTDGGTSWTQVWDKTIPGVFENFVPLNVVIPMTPFAGNNNVKIKFNYVGNDGAALDIDDVELVSCLAPVIAPAAAITTTTATLNWTAIPASLGYEYVLNTVATDPIVAGTASTLLTFNATGLAPSSNNYFHLRNKCSATSFSAWETISFTTESIGPDNDNFANAIAISCATNYNGDTTAATIDEDSAPDGFGTDLDSKNVWYKYTGTGSAQTISLDLCGSSYDTSVLVYTGTSGSLTLIAANDDDSTCGTTILQQQKSKVSFTSNGTTTYYITVEGYNPGSIGLFTMNVTCASVNPPAVANQNCATSLVVPVNGVAISSDNSFGDVSPVQPSCDTFGSIQDVWFSFEAPFSGEVTCLVTNGTMTSANFTVYSGTCGALIETESACNQNLTAPTTQNLTGLVVGSTYYVQVWSNGAEQGTFSMKLSDTTTLATNTFSSTNFKSFPNPIKDVLNLSYDKNITSISVMNLLGQVVLTNTNVSKEAKINMSILNTGTYMVKVTSDNEVKTIKVIKE